MAKILGISGSPRREGNTSFAVKYALETLNKAEFETKYTSLSGKNIQPCISCGNVQKREGVGKRMIWRK